MSLSKNCRQHQCLKKEGCRYKKPFGAIFVCVAKNKKCSDRAPNPYGRYDPLDFALY